MNPVKCVAKFLFWCVGILVITGCAGTHPPEPAKPARDNRAETVIAQDFVNIMMQIEELSPATTVLGFGVEEGNPSEIDARSIDTDNAFGKALRSTAANNGYTLDTVDNPDGANYVSFSIAEFGDAVDGTTYTYDVSVGEIDFRRVYKPLEDGGIEPFKAMMVRGVDVGQLESDDTIFAEFFSDSTSLAQASTTDPAAVANVAETDLQLSRLLDSTDTTPGSIAAVVDDEPKVADDELIADLTESDLVEAELTESELTEADLAEAEIAEAELAEAELAEADLTTNEQPDASILQRPVSVAAPLISDLPEAGFEGSTAESGTAAQSLAGGNPPTGFKTIRKINIAVTGESNYESLLVDKKDVAEEILIFGDDSYVLGVRNKEILGQMMSEFNPDTDVVSVVGCSTGVTKIANGNAALAIGRANRVKEALLYSGIPHDKIFDEGCWSPQANSTPFPNRGVVVTVKRNDSKS